MFVDTDLPTSSVGTSHFADSDGKSAEEKEAPIEEPKSNHSLLIDIALKLDQNIPKDRLTMTHQKKGSKNNFLMPDKFKTEQVIAHTDITHENYQKLLVEHFEFLCHEADMVLNPFKVVSTRHHVTD